MEERRPTVAHRLEHAGLSAVQTLVRLVPESAALAVGAGVARTAGALRIRRRQVDESLALAFGDRPAGWRARIAREAYGHLGREVAMLLRLGALRGAALREAVLAHTTWGDAATEALFAELLEAAAAGQGSVLVTGHLGNWELAGAALAVRGLPLDAVAVRQRNPLIDRELRSHRDALGFGVLDRREAATRVPAALRAGRTVALVADQHTPGGVVLPFFGHPAATPKGPAVFALRTGAPVLAGCAVVRPGPPRRYHVFLERIEVPRSGDLDADIRSVTGSFTKALERRIEADPGQYLWHHRRWRRRLLEEPPPAAPVLRGNRP